MTNVSILNVAYRTSSALVAAIFCAYAVPTAFAYDHSSYNQTGLVIQYDGPDNGANASTLVNLGSAGSAFNLVAQTSDDKVEDGVIKVGHLAAGNYKNHGWAYSSAASTATAIGLWTSSRATASPIPSGTPASKTT